MKMRHGAAGNLDLRARKATHPARRPRRPDEGQGYRVAACRPRRHPFTQQTAYLQRQSVLREPLQNPQISAALPSTLRLHRGRQKLLSPLFRLVQSAASPCRDRLDDTGPGPLRSGRCHSRRTQNTLDHAFRENPERFVNKPPTPPDKPTAAWINPPTPKSLAGTPAMQNRGQRRVPCLPPFRPSNRHRQSPPACARWPASTVFRYVTPT